MARKTLRERFEENYTAVPVPTGKDGGFKMRYIYYAPWYYWDLPVRRLRKEKRLLLALSLLGLTVFLAAAVCTSDFNSRAAVFVPCVLSFCCHILELSGLAQFNLAQYRTTRMNVQEVERIMDLAPVARTILSALAGCICLWYTVRGEYSGMSLAVTGGFFACAGLAALEVYRFRRIPVRTEDNHTLEEMEMELNEGPAE